MTYYLLITQITLLYKLNGKLEEDNTLLGTPIMFSTSMRLIFKLCV
jgi:hypothetical protein